MTTHRVPSSFCPFCRHEFTAATNASGENRPGPGDATVCVECANVLVFGADLRPRPLTAQDMVRLICSGDWESVIKARWAVVAAQNERLAEAARAIIEKRN